MKKLLVLCLILSAVPVFAEKREMPPFAIPTARTNGMGGSYTAYTDTVFGLLVNPAAIMRVEQKSFFAFSPVLFDPMHAYGSLKSIGEVVVAAFGRDIDSLMDGIGALANNRRTPLGFDLREFPFALAWVADGLGVGLWSRFFMSPNLDGTETRQNLYCDVIMPIGFAMKILETDSQSVDVGITLKPFARVIVKGTLQNLGSGDPLSLPLIAGTGFDLGFMYRLNFGLSVGFTLNDILTRGRTVYSFRGDGDDNIYYVPFTMNLGAAFDLKIGNFWKTAPRFLANTGIAVAANWNNIVNTLSKASDERDFLLDMSVGVQITLLDMLLVRAGMNELQPAFGLGVNLGSFQIDAAYYKREYGAERGQISVPMLDLTVAFRPGAQKRDWSWTQRSIVGMIAGSDNL